MGANPTARLDAAGYLAHIRSEGRSLANAARSALGRPVPTCPGWSVDDLVAQIGRVHRRATLMVQERRMTEVLLNMIPAPPPAGLGRVDWLEEAIRWLADALAEAGPGSPVWNWTAGPQVAAFWFRWMAHETVVYRWDVEGALRQPTPVASELALDGIDELVGPFLPEGARTLPVTGPGGVLRLHCTDTNADWCINAGPAGPALGPGPAAADATVSATASDLMMFLWNRLAPGDLSVEGNPAIAARWQARLRG
jgi:uncharacterized protein (TIGR03083 family)